MLGVIIEKRVLCGMKLSHPEGLKFVPIVAIATAFEDFDLNTVENTRLLLETGETVGETKKRFGPSFSVSLQNVAFDVLVENDVSKLAERVEAEYFALIKESPQYRALNSNHVMAALARVRT